MALGEGTATSLFIGAALTATSVGITSAVLIVPVVDDGRVTGIITRSDFFRAVAERFLAAG